MKKFREAQERVLKAIDDSRHDEGAALTDLAAAMYAKGLAGDTASAKEFLDRFEGKVPTPVGGTDELPAIKAIAWLDTVVPPETPTPLIENALDYVYNPDPPALEGDTAPIPNDRNIEPKDSELS